MKQITKPLYFMLVGINMLFFILAALCTTAYQLNLHIITYSFINLINVGLNFFLIYMTGKGRHWAKITLIAWHSIFISLYVILLIFLQERMFVGLGYFINPFLGNICSVGFIATMVGGKVGLGIMLVIGIVLIVKIFWHLAYLSHKRLPLNDI